MDTKEKARRPVRNKQDGNKTSPEKRTSTTPKRASTEKQKPLQDVVYIPPKPFVRNRMLLRIAAVAAVVIALLLGMSVFFKVEHIQVSGLEQYTPEDISAASGIQKGDSLFSLGLPGIAAKIQKLDYVKDVRVGIRLPNTVVIEVTEVRVTYAARAQDGSWWQMNSSGRVIQKLPADQENEYTRILGVMLQNPKAGEVASAFEMEQPGVDENGNLIPVTVTSAQKLETALTLADLLERNGILGEAASIDVGDMGNLEIWYGEQYQMKLGDTSQLEDKISYAKGAVATLSKESHNSGVLDVTFRDKMEVIYTRFQ
ncbi:MAG: FtsQ-type POTRA domain-containing protein [Ruminococcaceae bacterium]|nr:FtsQ-type POTRA domain-containing protein [Oscillospiraceae bacterium]